VRVLRARPHLDRGCFARGNLGDSRDEIIEAMSILDAVAQAVLAAEKLPG
jgi:hypothetical protein